MSTASRAHEFGDLDRTGRAAEFVHYLDERGSLELMQLVERRDRGTNAMRLRFAATYEEV